MLASRQNKKVSHSGHWWLTPVILATGEAEIRRNKVQNQSRQIVHKILSQKNPSQKKGVARWLKR
jgi:hypothetical protein